MTPQQRAALRRTLSTRLNFSELQTLCFDLGLEYENLAGDTKELKVIALLNALLQRDQLNELRTIGAALRPDIAWDDLCISTVGTSDTTTSSTSDRPDQSITNQASNLGAQGNFYGPVMIGGQSQPISNPTRKLLDEHQILWLSTLLRYSPDGQKVDSRKVLLELLEHLPNDFEPKNIDYRFCSGGNSITLLGRTVINPDDRIVKHTNQIAIAIRDILRNHPKIPIITASQLAEKTGIPELTVAITLELMAGYRGGDYFHNSGTNYGGRGWASININDDVFKKYIKFQSLETIVNELLGI